MIHTLELTDLSPRVEATLDLPYAWTPNLFGASAVPLRMHVFYPAPPPEGAGYPALIWVCGGGWECCDVAHGMYDIAWFAERGYVVCMVEYRVTGVAPFPAQVLDVKTAVRFVRRNAARFRVDPARIALMGDSAGGHLVALAGLTPDHPDFPAGQWADASDRVQAVVDWYGISDFAGMLEAYGVHDARDMRPTDFLVKLFGGYPQDRPDLVRLATPLAHVAPGAPPFLLLHGDRDEVVPLAQSQSLHDRLCGAGVPCDLCVVKGAGHATAEFSQKPLLRYIADWLDRTL